MSEKEITWDELADIYHRETGGRARTQPMDSIFNWAVSRKDLFRESKDGGLVVVGEQEKGDGK